MDELELHFDPEAAAEAEAIERLMREPPRIPDWSKFACVTQMSPREFSLYVDAGRPGLGPKAKAAPPPPPAPRQPDLRAAAKAIATGVAEALGAELALLRGANDVLRERLEKLEASSGRSAPS